MSHLLCKSANLARPSSAMQQPRGNKPQMEEKKALMVHVLCCMFVPTTMQITDPPPAQINAYLHSQANVSSHACVHTRLSCGLSFGFMCCLHLCIIARGQPVAFRLAGGTMHQHGSGNETGPHTNQ